jgi:hypothetical protein
MTQVPTTPNLLETVVKKLRQRELHDTAESLRKWLKTANTPLLCGVIEEGFFVPKSRVQTQKSERFEFSDTEIDQRIADHWEFAEDFTQSMLDTRPDLEDKIDFVVNRRRLKIATSSAYQDIARYKDYHQKDPWNDNLDCVKRSAFLLKWVLKIKPIQIIGDNGIDADISQFGIDDLETINEMFALYLFELHLSDEIGTDIALSEQKMAELSYDLLYREISVDGWIAIFQMVKDCCDPKISPRIRYKAPYIDKL